MERRRFLAGGLAVACSAAASPFVTPVALASAPWDQRLVVILLRGAMDGLDVLRPVGDPDFTSLGRGAEGSAPLGAGFWARHDALAPLDPLWQAGELGFAHAVSTPYRDRRSHFDGQDLLEAGLAEPVGAAAQSGWLNRLVSTVPGAEAETAFAVGLDRLAILEGPARVARWAPQTRLALSPATARLLELVQHGDPLFRAASLEAIDIAVELARADDSMAGQGAGGHVGLASFAATRLAAETRIASFSLGGWDTHAQQDRAIANVLGRLAETILTLKAGLGAAWQKTAVLAVTEFGRTARFNGSGGTDHGTGGAMLLAGGALNGGRVVADWPGLSEAALYDRRDLMPTRDLRAHAAWVMSGLFGLDRATLGEVVFPGLELGADPGWTG